MTYDPHTVTENAAALTSAFNSIRALFGVFKDVKDILPKDKQATAAVAIEASEKQLKLAEVELAKALGYQLCQCEFPPNVMLAVGVISRHPTKTNERVFECKVCGADTAHPYGFDRFEPKTA